LGCIWTKAVKTSDIAFATLTVIKVLSGVTSGTGIVGTTFASLAAVVTWVARVVVGVEVVAVLTV